MLLFHPSLCCVSPVHVCPVARRDCTYYCQRIHRFAVAWCRLQGVGCCALGAGCRVQGAGCRVQGAGCRVQGAGCRVQGCRVAGLQGCRVAGLQGCRVASPKIFRIAQTLPSKLHCESIQIKCTRQFLNSLTSAFTHCLGAPPSQPAHPPTHPLTHSLTDNNVDDV